MRIGIDARMYREGLGIGRYIEQMLTHLQAVPTEDEYIVFLHPTQQKNIRITNTHFRIVLTSIPWYSLSEQLIFPILLIRHRLDLVHFPHFNVPLAYPGRFVMTVHDLILLKFPLSATSAASTRHPLIHWIKYRAFRAVVWIATHRASAIIAVSRYVKKDIQELLGIEGKKITVIYEAASELYQGKEGSIPATVRIPYILYAGNAYPHKNIGILLELVRRTADIMVVLCGQEDFFQKRLCERIQADDVLRTRVVHLGRVHDAVLAALYHHALAYVFPSFEEGFGLPALEALAHGVPVIASHSSVLPEILGDAALYFDPVSVDDLLMALTRIREDRSCVQSLVKKGSVQVARFSWSQTAYQTHQLYSSL